jgi:hypothetical protein
MDFITAAKYTTLLSKDYAIENPPDGDKREK